MRAGRRDFLISGTAGTLAAMGLSAHAQGVLEITRIFVGFPPGTSADVVARKVAEKLGRHYTRTAVAESRLGAGGQLAIAAMKGAAPDGSQIVLVPTSTLGTFPHTYKRLPYDTFADLTPVCNGASFDYAIGVGPIVPDSVRNIPDLLAWYKANPGKASMASPGAGTGLHFIVVMLGRAAGIELVHIPYRGSTPAVQDMIGGNLSALCTPLGAFLNQPKLRVLATFGPKRSRFTPEVATMAEQGYRDHVYEDGFSFFLPGKASPDTVRRLNAALREALADRDLVETFATFAMEPAPSTPDQLEATLKSDLQRWGTIVRAVGFTAEN